MGGGLLKNWDTGRIRHFDFWQNELSDKNMLWKAKNCKKSKQSHLYKSWSCTLKWHLLQHFTENWKISKIFVAKFSWTDDYILGMISYLQIVKMSYLPKSQIFNPPPPPPVQTLCLTPDSNQWLIEDHHRWGCFSSSPTRILWNNLCPAFQIIESVLLVIEIPCHMCNSCDNSEFR